MKQIAIYFTKGEEGPKMEMLLYIPNHVKTNAPAIIGLNFSGNATISNDTAIHLHQTWMAPGRGVINNRATDSIRGTGANRWQLEKILERGYAIATIYRGDIDPDYDDGFKNGIHALYPELQNRPDNFATIAAWAWALSRGLDYLQSDKNIDANRVAVFGFSRLGKAALWAGATDERFALVISNESGAGGAKLFHMTNGEKIERLSTRFPHWFDTNFRKYIGKDSILPFDQHMVISLIAPRPVYVASAVDDLNSNPEAEFWGAKGASPVYELLGYKGLDATEWPAVNQPVKSGRIAYHVRTGKHDVTEFDWDQYLEFADSYLRK